MLVGNSKGEITENILKHISEDNITIYSKEIGSKGVDCIHLPHDSDQFRALLNTVLNV
jgi:hypothetical protein